MAVPKRKTSRSVRNMRRSHDSLKKGSWQTCPECGEYSIPHHVCRKCGTYKKRIVLTQEADV